ncbi:MAG TPA: hypothetical protein VF174_03395 [Micromonosporaceae bacterium]
MGSTRPLRDAFNELLGGAEHGSVDPEAFLAAAGHQDLPVSLIGEAVVNYAETAGPEVAERLAPMVMAHTGIAASAQPGDADPGDWLDRLASVPATDEHGSSDTATLDGDLTPPPADDGVADCDLDFGYGSAGEAGGSELAQTWEVLPIEAAPDLDVTADVEPQAPIEAEVTGDGRTPLDPDPFFTDVAGDDLQPRHDEAPDH